MCFEEKVSYQQLKFLERFTELIKKKLIVMFKSEIISQKLQLPLGL